MLFTIAVILLVLWLLGLVSGYTMGNFIYVLLVIALVLMTVFNQFSTRQAGQKAMEYSQFIEEVKQGNVAKVTIEGRVLKGVKRSGERRNALRMGRPSGM